VVMGGTEWMDGGKLDVDGRAWRILCSCAWKHLLAGCERENSDDRDWSIVL
jgi:hypothetical protein